MSAPRLRYDPKFFGIVAAAGTAAAFVCAILAKIFSDSWRTNETFFFAAVLALVLAGLFTWMPVKQPDLAKFIPPALLVVFALFVSGDLSDAYGNHESMERFWNTLPSFAAICAASAATVYLTWWPKLLAWAGKGPPVPAPRTSSDSGKRVVKLKKSPSGPKKKSPPAPAKVPQPSKDSDEERTVDEHVPLDEDGENTVEEQVPDDSGPVRKPEITMAPPKRKKR